jgi:hypothetical protein
MKVSKEGYTIQNGKDEGGERKPRSKKKRR